MMNPIIFRWMQIDGCPMLRETSYQEEKLNCIKPSMGHVATEKLSWTLLEEK